MTVSLHGSKRMTQRNITIKMILNCIERGQKTIQNNGNIKITDGLISVIVCNNKLITVHFTSKTNEKIKKISRKEKINFRQATQIFLSKIA